MDEYGPHGPDLGRQIPDVTWVQPDFEKEFGEYERIANTFFKNLGKKEILHKIHETIASATPAELSDEEFEALENSQAWHGVRPGFLEDVEKVIKENIEQGGSAKDMPGIIAGFKEGQPMQMPVALTLPNGKNHLVSGNTRLLVARALGIRPRILLIDLGIPITAEDYVSEPDNT